MSALRLPLRVLSVLLIFCVFAPSFFMINALVVGLSACRPGQIQSLMEFKSEFDSSGCNQSDYVNGVECNNATGAVTKLQLPSGCLSGILKPNSSLFSLHHLRYLNLSHNSFASSSLPSGFGSFSKLEVLSLSSNGFIGQVPSSFSNLSQLSILDLSYNELTSSFPHVRNLTKLYHLDLSYNHLSGTLNPNSSLFELHHLRYLDLGYNNFGRSSIPYEFGNLNRLEVLSLSSSHFLGQVPFSFSNLSRLTELYLDNNELTGSFQHVQNLTNLSILRLYHSQFEGHILEPISKLITLTDLDLSFLNISYPIDIRIFSSLKSLVILDLSGNSISPTSLSSDLDIPLNLKILFLSDCQISEFPNFLKNLHSLETILMSNNKIKGKVPEWLWTLPRLKIVFLINNSLTQLESSEELLVNSTVRILGMDFNHFKGPFPKLPLSINILSLSNNSFTGNIPLEICNRSSLTLLDLSYNNFTGPIPQCLSNFTVVNLLKNNLEGSLPDMCYDGVLLQTLDVGYNQLTGKLPRSLLNCSSLKFVSLDHNRLRDTFPFWLKALPDIQALTLRSNKFYGPISPPHQGPLAFPKLRILEISDNNFTGSLPPNYFVNWEASSQQMDEDGRIYMGNYNNPYYVYDDTIDLQYKGLSMEQEKILTFYATIDFSRNNLEGQIPESIGLLKPLTALNLSGNAFTGHIPLSLANLTVLESLDLSRNQLSGTIPNELKTLSFLAYINLSHNQLKGEIPQGTQIIGQSKSSFEGNAGLCGLPLDETCFGTNAPPIRQSKQEEEEEEEEEVLYWEAVVIGYGPGVLLGLAIEQVIASYKPEWLIMIIGPYKRRNN